MLSNGPANNAVGQRRGKYSRHTLISLETCSTGTLSWWPLQCLIHNSRITAALNRNPSTRIQTYRKEAACPSLFCRDLSASLESYTDTKFLNRMLSHVHQGSSNPYISHLPIDTHSQFSQYSLQCLATPQSVCPRGGTPIPTASKSGATCSANWHVTSPVRTSTSQPRATCY